MKIESKTFIAVNYTYDAFGAQIGESADTNPFRYCGEYWDSESGLIYLRARYYDSGVGAFISEDTHWNVGNMIYGDSPGDNPVPSVAAILQSGNLYVCCGNNPICRYDPSGNNWGINAWNAIWNAVNSAQKAAQRVFWKTGSQLLLRNYYGYETAAWLLEHSLQDNPSDVYRDNDSRIAGLINQDEAFSSKVNEAILNSNGNNLDNAPIGVTFTSGDLYYSIHESNIYLTGYKRNDGSWIIHCVLVDTYDFTEIQSFMGDDGSFQWDAPLGTAANDAAYISQKTGAIQTYEMKVEFWITR